MYNDVSFLAMQTSFPKIFLWSATLYDGLLSILLLANVLTLAHALHLAVVLLMFFCFDPIDVKDISYGMYSLSTPHRSCRLLTHLLFRNSHQLRLPDQHRGLRPPDRPYRSCRQDWYCIYLLHTRELEASA